MKKPGIYCIILLTAGFTACQKKMTHAMYEGKDLSQSAYIIRDKETKSAKLEIQTEGAWKLYAGNTVESIDFSKPLVEGKMSGTYPLDVNNATRSYFQLETKEGKAILAERHLPMEGGFNFRDLGGLRNKKGKYLKWGKLFRSDELSNLTESDLNYLAGIPIRTVIDFRSESEIEQAPDKLPASVNLDRNLNIEPGNIMSSNIEFDIDTIDFNQLMIEMNRALVSDSACIAQYTEFFRIVQDENNIPLLYHCTAGKDRTGMGTALILFSLGMEEEVVMNDYLLSAEYIKGKFENIVKAYPMIEPLMTVKREFLQAGIDEIKTKYGSIENYLTEILKVDSDKMQKMFLY